MTIKQSQAFYQRPLVFVILLTMLNAGCAGESTHDLKATPTPPTAYNTLPKLGRIDCGLKPKSGVFIWEHPGLMPKVYDDSGYTTSSKGKQKGIIPGCALVNVTNFVWSEYDNVFYLYVKQDSLEGWALGNYVDLSYSQ